MKAILSFILLVCSFYSPIFSQSFKYFAIKDLLPYSTFTYSRLKYDSQGNLYILYCDGRQFFVITNKNGDFTTPKPIALKQYNHPNFWNSSKIDGYDFEIDENGVIHIAFYILDGNLMHMFYTNSIRDSAIYFGQKTHNNFIQHPINSLISISKTGIDDITINFITSSNYGSFGWLRVVNPHKPNRNIQEFEFTNDFPIQYASLGKTKMLLFDYAVILIDKDPSTPPDSSLLITKRRIIHNNGTISPVETSSNLLISPYPDLYFPYLVFDKNDDLFTADNIIYKSYGTFFNLEYRPEFIYAFDNSNSIHKVKRPSTGGFTWNFNYGFPPFTYSVNNLNVELKVNKNEFNDSINRANVSLAAYSQNKAAILIRTLDYFLNPLRDYLFIQENGSIKTYLIPSTIYFNYLIYTGPSILKLNNDKYIIQQTNFRLSAQDSLIPAFAFKLVEVNNDYQILYDFSKLKQIKFNFDNYSKIEYDTKDDRINYFVFTNNNLYYNKQINDEVWQSIKLNRSEDTVQSYSFSRDGNNVLHIVYLNSTGKIFYTKDLSGSFTVPIEILNITDNPSSIKLSTTKDGNLYIVLFYNYSMSKYIYGNISGFSTPKQVEIYRGSEIEVNKNGYLYAINDREGSGTYKVKIYRDSIIYSGFAWNLPYIKDLKLVKDSNWNIHLVGFMLYYPQRIVYSNSNLDFDSYSYFDVDDKVYDLHYFAGNPLYDNSTNTIYFLFVDIWSFTGIESYTVGKLPLESTGIITEKENVPLEFNLYQNFPNPFNAKTIIQFDLPVDEFVNLSIYDLLGRKIKSVINSELKSGKHKIELDLNEFSSGIYFYTIEAGKFKQTRKMIMLK